MNVLLQVAFSIVLPWTHFFNEALVPPPPDGLNDTYSVNSEYAAQRFDGIGGLSGGGSTSKLIFNGLLTEQQIEGLFQELFGEGGLQMVKVEIGGDDQSTEGVEASHMHTRDDLNFNRGYEWQVMKYARKVNPKIPIIALSWTFPRWLGNGTDDPFFDVYQTADYTVKWIEGALNVHGVLIDYVGIWNERPNWKEEYVYALRETLDARNFSNVKIVLGDEFKGTDFDRMLNANLTEVYDVIGVHYPGGKMATEVQASGMTLWSSEDYSTEQTLTGIDNFYCMARTLNWNYVFGQMTGTIIWHLFSGFYKEVPYYSAGLGGLKSLTQPEWYTAYNAVKATTRFTRAGWHHLQFTHGSGQLNWGGTYAGYTDGSNLTIVIETSEWKTSLCMYANAQEYYVLPKQNVTFLLEGKFAGITKLYKYYANLPTQYIGISVSNSRVTLEIDSNSVITLTTMPPVREKLPAIPADNDPDQWSDDFENYPANSEPRLLTPQRGTWEVLNGTAVQTITEFPIPWCGDDVKSPLAIMKGSNLSISMMVPAGSTAGRVFVGVHTNSSGCSMSASYGVFVSFKPQDKNAIVFNHFGSKQQIASFQLPFVWNFDEWLNVGINYTQNGRKLHVVVNDFSTDLTLQNVTTFHHLVAIGSYDFGVSKWDNLHVYGPLF